MFVTTYIKRVTDRKMKKISGGVHALMKKTKLFSSYFMHSHISETGLTVFDVNAV